MRARRPPASRLASAALATVAVVLLASGCIMNGTWTPATPAVVPPGGGDIELTDVSCVSADWCMAVGYNGFDPLVEVWDGSGWTVETAPPPIEEVAQVRSIDCGTPTSCLAEIDRFDVHVDGGSYLVAWDGEQWLEVPPGNAIGGAFQVSTPYACAPDGSCVAVIEPHEVTVEWDGAQFTTTPFTASRPSSADDVNALDCFGSGTCVAALTTGLATWDGISWSPGVGGGDPGYADIWPDGPSELACSSTTECIATGDVAPDEPVAGQWNGADWTERDLPAGWTTVYDVSCAGAGSCLSVGLQSFDLAVAAWSGDTWYVAPGAGDQLLTISCLPLWCMGTGPYFEGGPRPVIYTWTNP